MEADQVDAQWDEEEKAIRARLNVSHTASQKQITGFPYPSFEDRK